MGLGKRHLSHTNIEILLIKKTVEVEISESKTEKMNGSREELSIRRKVAKNLCDWVVKRIIIGILSYFEFWTFFVCMCCGEIKQGIKQSCENLVLKNPTFLGWQPKNIMTTEPNYLNFMN